MFMAKVNQISIGKVSYPRVCHLGLFDDITINRDAALECVSKLRVASLTSFKNPSVPPYPTMLVRF